MGNINKRHKIARIINKRAGRKKKVVQLRPKQDVVFHTRFCTATGWRVRPSVRPSVRRIVPSLFLVVKIADYEAGKSETEEKQQQQQQHQQPTTTTTTATTTDDELIASIA